MKRNTNLKWIFFFSFLIVGLLIVSVLSISQNNNPLYEFNYDSQTIFATPIEFTAFSSFTLYNTSAFVLGSQYSPYIAHDFLQLTFDANFTHIISIINHSVGKVNPHLAELSQMVTDGQQFFVLGNNDTPQSKISNYGIVVMNKTFSVLQTIPLCSFNINTTTICEARDLNIWNNSLWVLENYYFSNPESMGSVLAEYNSSTLMLEQQYLLPINTQFVNIIPVNNKTLWLFYLIYNNNGLSGYYAFNSKSGTATKVAPSEGAYVSYPYVPADTHPLILPTGKALTFLTDFQSFAGLYGFITLSVISSPPIPLPLSLPTIFINDFIFATVVTIIIWFSQVKTLSVKGVRKIRYYLDSISSPWHQAFINALGMPAQSTETDIWNELTWNYPVKYILLDNTFNSVPLTSYAVIILSFIKWFEDDRTFITNTTSNTEVANREQILRDILDKWRENGQLKFKDLSPAQKDHVLEDMSRIVFEMQGLTGKYPVFQKYIEQVEQTRNSLSSTILPIIDFEKVHTELGHVQPWFKSLSIELNLAKSAPVLEILDYIILQYPEHIQSLYTKIEASNLKDYPSIGQSLMNWYVLKKNDFNNTASSHYEKLVNKFTEIWLNKLKHPALPVLPLEQERVIQDFIHFTVYIESVMSTDTFLIQYHEKLTKELSLFDQLNQY